MHDQLILMDQRVERVWRERVLPASTTTVAHAKVTWWPVPDESGIAGRGEPVPWDVAREATYDAITLPHPWGPTWGTTWLKVEVDVPEHAPGDLELAIDLGWADHSVGFQAEGLVRDESGRIIKGLHPRNAWVPVPDTAGRHVWFVEAAANPLILGVPPFVPTADSDKATADPNPIYVLRSATLERINHDARELARDLQVLSILAAELPSDSPRRWRIAMAMQDALNALDTEDVIATAAAARAALKPALSVPADADAMQISAIGHAHIDTAWLWPLRETRRKMTRTLANVVQLLDSGHDFVFALPASQHVDWLATDNPALLARVREWVDRGKIVPVGSMWVEPDAVLPSGESMCRQFLFGQRAFERLLGRRATGMWLPDSFGYSAALPQIAAQAGAEWFLTQKISWNQVDVFPHTSFLWEGIDGTRIFTHFPPSDTYGAEITGAEAHRSERNFKEKGRAASAMMLFGYGDGGGGPNREMLARAERMADVAGAPRISFDTPDAFFARAMTELDDPSVWAGELYLELHRGTFTSQVATKQGNRRNEHLLREAELWWTTAAVRGLGDYPWDELDACWRAVLLGQFHDILPGTSIAWVHRENAATHADVTARLESLIDQAQALLAGEGDDVIAFNAAPHDRQGITALAAGRIEALATSTVTTDGDRTTLSNGLLTAVFDRGLLVSLTGVSGRETLPPGTAAGMVHLIPDFPNMWDAWDTERFQREDPEVIVDFTTSIEHDGDAAIVTSAAFRNSHVSLRWSLHDDELCIDATVDWHEYDRLLKLVLPVDVHTTRASFETQFGHIERDIHENTSWDAQRFEVSTHRYVHVAEPGFGVGIVNTGSYGLDLLRRSRDGGGSYVVARPSLVRGPRYPDPHTDQGTHEFGFSVIPDADLAATTRAAYRRNLRLRTRTGSAVAPLVAVEGAIIDTVKLAEDRSGDVIVRLYEATGGRSTATLRGDFTRATLTNILEEVDTALGTSSEGVWRLPLRPFELVTLRLAKEAPHALRS